MNIQELTDYFLKYGAFFIYLIVFLEYLNLPGFPAGGVLLWNLVFVGAGYFFGDAAITFLPGEAYKAGLRKYSGSLAQQRACGIAENALQS